MFFDTDSLTAHLSKILQARQLMIAMLFICTIAGQVAADQTAKENDDNNDVTRSLDNALNAGVVAGATVTGAVAGGIAGLILRNKYIQSQLKNQKEVKRINELLATITDIADKEIQAYEMFNRGGSPQLLAEKQMLGSADSRDALVSRLIQHQKAMDMWDNNQDAQKQYHRYLKTLTDLDNWASQVKKKRVDNLLKETNDPIVRRFLENQVDDNLRWAEPYKNAVERAFGKNTTESALELWHKKGAPLWFKLSYIQAPPEVKLAFHFLETPLDADAYHRIPARKTSQEVVAAVEQAIGKLGVIDEIKSGIVRTAPSRIKSATVGALAGASLGAVAGTISIINSGYKELNAQQEAENAKNSPKVFQSFTPKTGSTTSAAN